MNPEADFDEALHALFEQRQWLHRVAKRLAHDDSAAMDLVQETFLAAIKNPPPDATRPRPWLFVLARRIQRDKDAGLSSEYVEEFVLAPNDRWQIYRLTAGKWMWGRLGEDGNVIYRSPKGFESRAECEEDARLHGWGG